MYHVRRITCSGACLQSLATLCAFAYFSALPRGESLARCSSSPPKTPPATNRSASAPASQIPLRGGRAATRCLGGDYPHTACTKLVATTPLSCCSDGGIRFRLPMPLSTSESRRNPCCPGYCVTRGNAGKKLLEIPEWWRNHGKQCSFPRSPPSTGGSQQGKSRIMCTRTHYNAGSRNNCPKSCSRCRRQDWQDRASTHVGK